MDSNNRESDGRRMEYMYGNYYCMVHVIRPGDTLYRLSRQYGVKVSALMMANPFVDIYNLRIGDELCIPRLGRPENMPEMPAPPRPMPGMPSQPMPEHMSNDSMMDTTSHMMSEDEYEEDEPVINVELPEIEEV